MSKLYLESGYLNIPYIMSCTAKTPFIDIIGARGIGKTYGCLEYVVEHKMKFLYIRRTQVQCDTVTKPEFNPFKKLNTNKGWTYQAFPVGKANYAFYQTGVNENGKVVPIADTQVGIAGALSTFSNLRGFDASDVEIILYDEFVPELSDSVMKGEADAFFNMVETVNRNRELEGKPPVPVICMSNSTNAANPLFIALEVVGKVMKMEEKHVEKLTIPDRGLMIIRPDHSPISEAKKQTALYKLTKGTNFYESALENKFINNTPTSVYVRPIKEYIPYVEVGEVCIYKHKSNQRYYVSQHKTGSPPKYGASDKELAIFRKRYHALSLALYGERVDYESYTCELLFDKYLNMVYT